MTEYFKLQFKMLNRRILEFGMPPLIGYLVVLLVFGATTGYLFSITEYAGYLCVLVALGFTSRLSEPKRNDFLKSIFNQRRYLTLRLLENLLCSLPFLIVLLYHGFLTEALLLILGVILGGLFHFNTNLNTTIPTPFGRKPFEYVIGFRTTFFIFPFAYLITAIAISTGNFNLGIASIALIALVCMSYYHKPENEYFVWNFALSPKRFLLVKIKSCLLNFTLLSIPNMLALSFFFPSNSPIVALSFLVCCIYLATIVLAKYSVFPNEPGLAQEILVGISFVMPLILVATIPLFYSQSVTKLKAILE